MFVQGPRTRSAGRAEQAKRVRVVATACRTHFAREWKLEDEDAIYVVGLRNAFRLDGCSVVVPPPMLGRVHDHIHHDYSQSRQPILYLLILF